ncbi:unnamed protein product [Psylliodes chrysocephalus]|uniref:Uncharacterized protein n=1 Tax=Psylliodes chrysocephalus TaxID=3402493 RepID=A0A9P0GER8_9CUCU|nr:unnamed protein product [Psylliodes chrysocephala]
MMVLFPNNLASCKYEHKFNEQVDLIVDKGDVKNYDNDNIEEKNILNDNKSINSESDLEEDTNDGVMLIDQNKELIDQVKIVAPGQGKTPVRLHMIEDIDELCFPKIFGGHKLNVPKFITYSDQTKS